MPAVAVLSPHLDDALFSAYDLLSRGPHELPVVTLFAGVPHGHRPGRYDALTASTDPAERYEQRRAEDRAAAELVGWTPVHLDHLDAPYRSAALDLDVLVDSVLGALDGAVHTLWVPAGIGGHADHMVCREVGERCARSLGAELVLYADYPYAALFGWPGWVTGTDTGPYLDVDAYLAGWIDPARVRSATVVRLDEGAARAKLAAMQRYVTQFPAQEAGPSRELSHPERLPYELYWRVPAPARSGPTIGGG